MCSVRRHARDIHGRRRDAGEYINDNMSRAMTDLSICLGRLHLPNPVMVASGTFGYGREMQPFMDLRMLGALIPKTITRLPRQGNAPPRTVETSSGLLNAIGLDNDGLDAFIAHHIPYLEAIGCPIVVSIAGQSREEFVAMASQLSRLPSIAALELNISCPNVAGGIDFATDATMCEGLVAAVRAQANNIPVLAKLSPNVTSISDMARAAEAGGADAICLINTVLGMSVDWRRRRPMLANVVGGLSGPAIKPIALRCVYQASKAVQIPLVGIGGIASLDDAMEFLVSGASAIQVGTANYHDPALSQKIIEGLPGAIASLGAHSIREIIGSLEASRR